MRVTVMFNSPKYPHTVYTLATIIFSFAKLALVNFDYFSRATLLLRIFLQNNSTDFTTEVVKVYNGMVRQQSFMFDDVLRIMIGPEVNQLHNYNE